MLSTCSICRLKCSFGILHCKSLFELSYEPVQQVLAPLRGEPPLSPHLELKELTSSKGEELKICYSNVANLDLNSN